MKAQRVVDALVLVALLGTFPVEAKAEETQKTGTILTTPIATSLSDSGVIPRKAGSYARWIERVELPRYGIEFYDALVEATDHDGMADVLIDDEGFFPTSTSSSASAWEKPGALVTTPNGIYWTLGNVGSAQLSEVANAISLAYAAFDRDHPEVFWLSGSCRVGGVTNDRGELCAGVKLKDSRTGYDLRIGQYQNQKAIESALRERDGVVASLAAASQGTPAQKVRAFHRYLVTRNTYNAFAAQGKGTGGELAWKCLSALTGKTGIAAPTCEGYARAFKVLCDASGIPCVLSCGYGSSNGKAAGRHMWNLVELEGRWYGVDVTWDDPLAGTPSEAYLLVGSTSVVRGESFAQTHRLDNWTFTGLPSLNNEPSLTPHRYDPSGTVAVYRLWNAYSGAHLLTADSGEYQQLSQGMGGWRGEGTAFYVPKRSNSAVFRLYNPTNGDHLYTASLAEYRALQSSGGWRGEGVAFFSAEGSGAYPVYRLWNELHVDQGGLGSHLWTANEEESRALVAMVPRGAWHEEGVAWRAEWLPLG